MANEFYQNPAQNPQQNPAPVQENAAPQYAAPQYTAPAPEYAAPQYTAPAPEMPYQQAPAKKSKKGLWIALGAVAVAAIVAVVLIFFVFGGGSGGKYTTPLDLWMDIENAKTFKAYQAASVKVTNGLFDDEMKTIQDLEQKSDYADDGDWFEEQVEEYEDEYGSDYKFYYEVDEKEKLDSDDLKDLQEELRDDAEATLEEIEDTDPEDLADQLGLSEKDAEKYIDVNAAVYKVLKSAKITEGYELEVTIYAKGKELDEPEEIEECTITVVKVNGKWVDLDDIR